MTAGPPHKKRFREHTRAPLVAQVRLQFDSFDDPQDGFTADVSAGGMFVTLQDPKPVGTRLRFWLGLPDGRGPAHGFGEVVWIRLQRDSAGQPPGIGIEFRHLEASDRDRISEEVERIIKERALPQESSLSKEDKSRTRKPPAEDL